MRRVAFVSLLITAASCRPDFGERESLVTGVQVLAVRADPPDVKPSDQVTYTPLVVDVRGPIASPQASWAFCATPKLLTENGAVSRACLGAGVRPIGDGSTAAAATPSDACALFGPEVTSADLRPRDPDATGGFYQPVRLVVASDDGPVVAFGASRLRCNLASAGVEVAGEFQRRYVPNTNPELLPLDATAPLDAIPRGARVTLRASWPVSAQESYVVIDPVQQRVVDRREELRLSWHATSGAFEHDRTGRTADETETFTENAWQAPDQPGDAQVFVVLRDDRGGVAFASYAVVVR